MFSNKNNTQYVTLKYFSLLVKYILDNREYTVIRNHENDRFLPIDTELTNHKPVGRVRFIWSLVP